MQKITQSKALNFLNRRMRKGFMFKYGAIIFLDVKNSPVAFINKKGLFGAAKGLVNGQIWFSYPTEKLETEFKLNDLSYSDKSEVCLEFINQILTSSAQ